MVYYSRTFFLICIYIFLFTNTLWTLAKDQVFYQEFIIFKGSSLIPECYHPSLLYLPDGSLVCVWASGSGPLALDTSIKLSLKKTDNQHWTSPITVADDEGYPDNYPVLAQLPGDKIRLIYATLYREKRKAPPGANLAAWHLKYMESDHPGHIWGSDFFLIPESGQVPCSRVIKLVNGNLILPVSTIGEHNSLFLVSEDKGIYWEEFHQINDPTGLVDPVLVELKPGHLLALLRPSEEQPLKHLLWQVESLNNGQTWSEPKPTELKNPGSPIELLKLNNGDLVLAYNNHELWMTPMTLAVSRDGGKTWPDKRNLETGQWDIRDPSLIQTADGHIHITYVSRNIYLRHIELSESWIFEQP